MEDSLEETKELNRGCAVIMVCLTSMFLAIVALIIILIKNG